MNRFRSKRFLDESRCLLFLIAALAAGCDLPGRPDPVDRPVPANEVLNFSVLYGQNCAGCHGANGKLGPAPPLNDPLFRAIIPVEELENIITRGRPKTLMPAFAEEFGGPLTAAQVQVLVKEIKGVPYRVVKKGEESQGAELDGRARSRKRQTVVDDAHGILPQWGVPAPPPKGVPKYLLGNSAGNKDRGAKIFARACGDCHGGHGQGIRKGDETVRAIHDSVFLALISDQTLRRYVITGRPDFNMPNFAEERPSSPDFKALTDQDVADLVELLASWRRDRATRTK